MSAPVGVGGGQFPTPAQLLTYGHVVIRKSDAASTATRFWMMFADAYTFYFYAWTNDGFYYPFWFGDIFSLKSTGTDVYRCMIKGRQVENSITGNGYDTGYPGDTFGGMSYYVNYSSIGLYCYSVAGNAAGGTFLTRTVGGGGTSVIATMVWDISKSPFVWAYSRIPNTVWYLDGILPTPNSADNTLYIDPLYIGEVNNYGIRGRHRGIYHLGHYGGNFTDGQILDGGGDYAGKQFMIVKGFGNANLSNSTAIHLVEISNTVETND
jgi:hypothetical protein